MFAFFDGGLQYVGTPFSWVDFVISLIIFGGAFFLLFRVIKRRFAIVTTASLMLVNLLAWFFSLNLLFYVTLASLVVFIVVVLIVNQYEIRVLNANSLAGKFSFWHHNSPEKVFDRSALYQKIALTVETLSKNRIGALITFERKTKLDDFVKSGTILNAPVTPELLTTIFYPGTRLHDGAVVIKGNEIVSAAVFYTPSTKAFAGKYGSRHRAAIGISEISDSVTVVVSEETGRISFAVNGQLETCDPQNFVRVLETYMSVKEENAEE